MTEFQILSALKNNGGCMEYTALLNQNMTDTNRDPSADEARISQMIKDKLLEGKAEAYHNISITKYGRMFLQDALQAINEKLKDQAKQEKQQSFDNKISVASVLIPLVTFFLGIIIKDWLTSLL